MMHINKIGNWKFDTTVKNLSGLQAQENECVFSIIKNVPAVKIQERFQKYITLQK